MLKKTPFKTKNSSLKKSTLKPKNNKGLKKSSSLRNNHVNLKKDPTKSLSNKNSSLATNINKVLKKQSDEAKEKWDRVRKIIIKRDEGKCVVCGKAGSHVHHIHLRSKRKDLLYEINNLVLLCSEHHDHSSADGLERVNSRIARAKRITLEELYVFAETKSEE